MRGLASGATALSLPRLLRASSSSDDRPNVLLFLSDDHGRFEAGCYGNTAVSTPNIDALAAGGLRFERAYTSTSLCSPSRSTLYTGLSPMRNGCLTVGGRIDRGVRSLPVHLSDHGVTAALLGKKHVAPPRSFPFEPVAPHGMPRFLSEHGDRPFCLVYASREPHRPYPKPPKTRPDDVLVPPYLLDTPETRAELAGYYDLVQTMDRQLGRCLNQLADAGLEDRTLVLYASDHGTALPFSKFTLYEAGLRVPFVARLPGRIAPGGSTDALVDFVDVVPTLLALFGVEAPPGLDGRSFLDVLLGKRSAHRERIFGIAAAAAPAEGAPARSVCDATHKYVVNLAPDEPFAAPLTGAGSGRNRRYGRLYAQWKKAAAADPSLAARVRLYEHRPAEELYDLRKDPHELANLAGDPTQQPRIATFRAELVDWMREQGDSAAAELATPS